jgi:hypothetical protein
MGIYTSYQMLCLTLEEQSYLTCKGLISLQVPCKSPDTFVTPNLLCDNQTLRRSRFEFFHRNLTVLVQRSIFTCRPTCMLITCTSLLSLQLPSDPTYLGWKFGPIYALELSSLQTISSKCPVLSIRSRNLFRSCESARKI